MHRENEVHAYVNQYSSGHSGYLNGARASLRDLKRRSITWIVNPTGIIELTHGRSRRAITRILTPSLSLVGPFAPCRRVSLPCGWCTLTLIRIQAVITTVPLQDTVVQAAFQGSVYLRKEKKRFLYNYHTSCMINKRFFTEFVNLGFSVKFSEI
ncbi:hypothetical protein ALC62_00210 [Cyphomyrmex costatus]|uniref:Uncharacterized protein n=1 Tax=Cyphomyrmex costatus TaxID=456900 RepID=A0A195D8J9_9HYME|nr:hypothetical protein ALC62_00210 [Cyphomyrmex costatus]